MYTDVELNDLSSFFGTVATYRPDRMIPFLFIPNLPLPKDCKPERTDAVFIPELYQGYSSRLYLKDKVIHPSQRPGSPNWQDQHVIYGESWHVYSYNNVESSPFSKMVLDHLRGLLG